MHHSAGEMRFLALDAWRQADVSASSSVSANITKALTYAQKVTPVLDGGNINDGTFNQLAYEGALAACTADASCCLEVDRVDDDVEDENARAAPAPPVPARR